MKVDAKLLLVLVAACIARGAVAWGGDVNCASKSNPWAVAQCCVAGKGSPDTIRCCASCAAAVGNNKAYACQDCARLNLAGGLAGDCTACVQSTAGKNREWACPQVCFNKGLTASDEGLAGACTTCYTNANDASVGSCGDCLRNAAVLANVLHLPLTNSALKTVSFKCMTYTQKNKDAWAGPACLQQATLAKVSTCIDCLLAGNKQAWQCVQMAKKM